MNCTTSIGTHWKPFLRCLQAVVTCVLLVVLFRACQSERLAALWRAGDVRLWIVCVLFVNLSMVLGALALFVLVRSDGSGTGWTRFLLDYAHVQAICLITPAQIGEALLPFMGSAGAVSPGRIAAGLVVQRIVAVVIVAATAACFTASWSDPRMLIATVGVALFGCVVVACLISHSGVRAFFNQMLGRRYGAVLDGFHATWLRIFREHWRLRLGPHVSLMIARFAASVAASFVVFRSFDIPVPFFALAGILALATLASLVPLSFGGIGVVEAVSVLSLSHFGIGSEEVLSTCVTGRGLTALVFLSWSLLYWVVRWSEVRSRQKTV